jgi:hypothetical protein
MEFIGGLIGVAFVIILSAVIGGFIGLARLQDWIVGEHQRTQTSAVALITYRAGERHETYFSTIKDAAKAALTKNLGAATRIIVNGEIVWRSEDEKDVALESLAE